MAVREVRWWSVARKAIDANELPGEKRLVARRARRLAQNLAFDPDRTALLEYAAELGKEAEALERSGHGCRFRPPNPQCQQQQSRIRWPRRNRRSARTRILLESKSRLTP